MFMKRTLIAAAAALALTAAPVYAESEAEPADIESVVEDYGLEDDGSFAESIYLVFEDAYRNALSESGMDASWLQTAQVDVAAADDGGVTDVNILLTLNETELYHINLNLDLANMTVGVQCPELKEQPILIDLSAVSSEIDLGGIQLSQEEIQKLAGQLFEYIASVPAEQWQEELGKYMGIVMSRLQQSTGTATVTVGDVSVEANTVTFGFDSTAVAEAIPELLTTVSEDELIKGFFESDFMDTVAALIVRSQGGDPEGVTGEVLYEMLAASVSELAVTGDFSSIPGAQVTIGMDENGTPCLAELDLLMSGMSLDIFKAGFLASEDQHAYQVELGAMIVSSLGFSTENLTGLQGAGGVEDGVFSENAQVLVNGEPVAVISLDGFDLEALAEGNLTGTASVRIADMQFDVEYFTTDDGWNAMTFYMNGEPFLSEYFAVTSGGVTVDKLDTSDAFTVADEESLGAYLEDANLEAIFEKLLEAGVPEEVIDAMLGSEDEADEQLAG